MLRKLARSSVFLVLSALFGAGAAQAQTARLQVIHNAADPAADTVDVWVNNNLLLDNFVFRTATPFISVPAGVDLQVRIKPANSADTTAPLFFRNYNLAANSTSILIANGVVGTGFAANPGGLNIGFNLWAAAGRETAASADSTSLLVVHGATDAPAVDVKVNRAANLFSNVPYGGIGGYVTVPSLSYVVGIHAAGSATAVAEYTADLTAYKDSALVVLASGFLTPSANNSGPAFGLLAVTPMGNTMLLPMAPVVMPMARLQVIHNAADPAADTVDVWVNNNLLLDNFVFRSATPFISVPAGVDLQVRIKPANSADTTAPLFFRSYNLAANSTSILIANGVVGTGFAANPGGINIGFNLWAAAGRETAASADSTSLLVVHGATDAPAVDVKVNRMANLFSNVPYGGIGGYVTVPSLSYVVGIHAAGSATAVAEYTADLTAYKDSALVVLASGFLTPSANNNGPAFGLLAVTPMGNTMLLPMAPVVMPMARLQVIHNAADPAADTVDVWVNNNLLLDNFVFRTATSFISVPAGVDLQVRIKPANSTDTTAPLFFRSYNLAANSTSILIANGVVGTGFAANPGDLNIGFNLWAAAGRETAASADSTSLLVVHGATDAPAVDVKVNRAANLFSNVPYGGIGGYVTVPSLSYVVGIHAAGSATAVAEYTADLTAYKDSALVVLASGFLTPSANNNGPAFGLLAVTPMGNTMLLPMAPVVMPMARLQVIHNAADPAADTVDVWVNNNLLLDNFVFRSATPFISVPAGVDLQVRIKPANSTDTTAPLFFRSYNLATNSTSILIANGVVGTGFAANPGGLNIGFNLWAAAGRETAASADSTSLLVVHGATDAPAVDVKVNRAANLFSNVPYGGIGGYVTVPSLSYVVGIHAAGSATAVAEYTADLTAYKDSALVVLASGFLTPSANNNGPAFGLLAVTPMGRAVLLPLVVSAKPLAEANRLSLYPNPASSGQNIYLNLPTAGDLHLIDIAGRQVFAQPVQAGAQTLALPSLPRGLYQVAISNGQGISRSQLVIE